jgi:DNA-directed RNA polymerase subunit RPC12/RpoP
MTERSHDSSHLPPAPSACPECACRVLTLISDSEYVTIYKCPQCGKLLAPVKKH